MYQLLSLDELYPDPDENTIYLRFEKSNKLQKYLENKEKIFRLICGNEWSSNVTYNDKLAETFFNILKDSKKIEIIFLFHINLGSIHYNSIFDTLLLKTKIKELKLCRILFDKITIELFSKFISDEKCHIKILSLKNIQLKPYSLELLYEAFRKNTSILSINMNILTKQEKLYITFPISLNGNYKKKLHKSNLTKLLLREEMFINENVIEIMNKLKQFKNEEKVSDKYTIFIHLVLRKYFPNDITKLILGNYHYFVNFEGILFKSFKKILFKNK
jgi:hypothetical protein